MTGATSRSYNAAAWSSRARSTADGLPLYCAAPSTTMASAVVPSGAPSSRDSAHTWANVNRPYATATTRTSENQNSLRAKRNTSGSEALQRALQPGEDLGVTEQLERLEQRWTDTAAGHRDANRRLRLVELQPVRLPDRLGRRFQRVRRPLALRVRVDGALEHGAGGVGVLLHHRSPRVEIDDGITVRHEVDHGERVGEAFGPFLQQRRHRLDDPSPQPGERPV